MSNQRDITAQSAHFRPERADWLRLRTLIFQRWMASFGQLAALLVATRHYGMQLPLGLCFLAVGLAVIANLIAVFIFPQNKRLTELEAMLTLLFDLAQLCFLLFLTGGLTNRVRHLIGQSAFHARFCAKGRYQTRMESIPVKLITHPQPGLFGAAAAFAQEHSA